MKIFVTSDQHLNHHNISDYCNRGFNTLASMNETLIACWNDVVSEDDTVYCLGDLIWGKDKIKIEHLLVQLKGNIVLVKGNHDEKALVQICQHNNIQVKDYYELKYNKIKIIMSHYPFLSWRGSGHRHNIMLHGHCHNTLGQQECRRFDVGVDHALELLGSFSPFSLDWVINYVNNANIRT